MAFLVQMRQCKKCGSVRNDEIITLYTWNLVQALQSASTASYKMPAPINDSICPNNTGCSLGSRKKIWEMQDFLQQKFGRNKKFFRISNQNKEHILDKIPNKCFVYSVPSCFSQLVLLL